jgi:hypothetical protein
MVDMPKRENKEMQKKQVARRAERDTSKEARNASRALRRAEGKDEEVSEDEESYEDESEVGSSVNRKHYSVGSVSFFIPSSTCARYEPIRTPSVHEQEALNTDRSLCTRKSTKIYPRPLHDPKTTLTPESDWSVNKIVPLTCTPPMHASEHITILSQLREALPSNNKPLTFRSPEHGDSIVHLYPIQCVLKNPDVGAVIDTGAQRGAAKHSDEILKHTNTSHSMQGAFGHWIGFESLSTLLATPPLNPPPRTPRAPLPLPRSRNSRAGLGAPFFVGSKRASLADGVGVGDNFLSSNALLIFSMILVILSTVKGVGSSARRLLKSFAPS